ncbi:MAG: Rrf2 family transcriptional regulator [Acidobacteria bacterium]|nr:Rrf2 family transcriptional regulator [Acidobacteriota bacterium]
MLTQTSESAIRELIYLAQHVGADPVSPRYIATKLGLSPTYTAKVTRLLVRANILRAHKGSLGGVNLNRTPAAITMLSIVEACQGQVVGEYCQGSCDPRLTCAFHRFSLELHQAIVDVLSRWTLADVLANPAPAAEIAKLTECKMLGRQQAERRPVDEAVQIAHEN